LDDDIIDGIYSEERERRTRKGKGKVKHNFFYKTTRKSK
jgi:hypothetical protein